MTIQPTAADRDLCRLIEVMDQITDPEHRKAWLLGRLARHAQQAREEALEEAAKEVRAQAKLERKDIHLHWAHGVLFAVDVIRALSTKGQDDG